MLVIDLGQRNFTAPKTDPAAMLSLMSAHCNEASKKHCFGEFCLRAESIDHVQHLCAGNTQPSCCPCCAYPLSTQHALGSVDRF